MTQEDACRQSGTDERDNRRYEYHRSIPLFIQPYCKTSGNAVSDRREGEEYKEACQVHAVR